MLITLSFITTWLAFCGLGNDDKLTSKGSKVAVEHASSTTGLERDAHAEGDSDDDEQVPMLGYRDENNGGNQKRPIQASSRTTETSGSEV